jgi:uncharacterized protein YceK
LKVWFKNIQTLLVIVLVVIIFLMRGCSSTPASTEPRIERDTVTEYITIEKESIVYQPKIKYITKVDIDTFLTPVDTLAILADYYAIRTYEDTQVLDSLNITITDTVSQNQILGRQIAYNFTYPRKTIKETIYINQRELYFGLRGIGNMDQVSYLGGEMLFKNKKKQVYSFGVGVNQNLVPVISLSMYWKLGK